MTLCESAHGSVSALISRWRRTRDPASSSRRIIFESSIVIAAAGIRGTVSL